MTPAPLVLHVLEALGGGTSKHLIDLVRHSTGVRHAVAVPRRRVRWLSDDAAVDQLRAAGAEVHIVEMRREPLHPRNALSLFQVRRLIHVTRPDVVHGHSSVGGALARVAATGSRAVCVYTANGVGPGLPTRRLERSLGHVTDHMVAVSASEGELMTRLGMARPGALTVIPNGIDLVPPPVRTLRLRAELGVPDGALLVGGLGRLVPQKDPVTFVQTCAMVAERHPDAHFVLVGSGPLSAEVRAEIRRADLDSRFHLLPEFESPASVLDELDVFLSTSRFEGGPYAPLEAIRAGVPVVLTAAVGNRDVVVDGVSGLLAPPGDAAALAAGVTRLLDEAGLAEAIRVAARTRLERVFDVRMMGQATGDLYRRLLVRPGAPLPSD